MKPLICNLKMNHTYDDMAKYKTVLGNIKYDNLVICPAYPFLAMMKSRNYEVCAQNVSSHLVGSFTGDVSAAMLKSIGVSSSLIGHSETKAGFGEVCDKLHQVLRQGLKAYVVITDTMNDYNYQYTSSVLLSAIRGLLVHISASDYKNVHFIYEPKYMIGKDEALPLQVVENVFSFLKQELVKDYGYEFPLYYGGGLTKKNIVPYYQSEIIDGLFVGRSVNHPEDLKALTALLQKSTNVYTG